MCNYELSDEEISEIHYMLGVKAYELKKEKKLYEKIGGELTAYIDDLKNELKLIEELEEKLLNVK